MEYALSQRPLALRLQPRGDRALSPPLIGGMVAFCDGVLSLAVAGGAYVFYMEHVLNAPQFSRYGAVSLFGTALILVINHFLGLYHPHSLFGLRNQVVRIVLSVTMAAATILMFGFLLQITSEYSRGWAALWFFGNQAGLLSVRCGVARWLTRREVKGSFRRPLVVVGTGPMGARLLTHLGAPSVRDVSVRGVFHDGPGPKPVSVGGFPVLGTVETLEDYVRDCPDCDVVLALPWDDRDRFEAIQRSLSLLPVDVYTPPGEIVFELARHQAQPGLTHIAGLPVLELAQRPLKGGTAVLKRAEDLILVSILLLIFGPLMAFIALGVKLDSPGPVLFRQKRFGFNNHPFDVLKFRTMYVDRCDRSGGQRTVRGDRRITRFGAFLRKSSLDELPQLLNVLRGEMSIVGPRAHPVAMMAGDKPYHEAVADYAARHRVRPGITGLAQVSGSRGEIDTLEKARRRVELDLQYIEAMSLWLDLKILLRTAVCILKDDNAY
ncbi:undecaprenyl-phosphate glucose phosphotransferase [Azospirillum sp. sgz302134]